MVILEDLLRRKHAHRPLSGEYVESGNQPVSFRSRIPKSQSEPCLLLRGIIYHITQDYVGARIIMSLLLSALHEGTAATLAEVLEAP